ncbi:hypothetical protein D3C86_1124080 [compost metagenome]
MKIAGFDCTASEILPAAAAMPFSETLPPASAEAKVSAMVSAAERTAWVTAATVSGQLHNGGETAAERLLPSVSCPLAVLMTMLSAPLNFN